MSNLAKSLRSKIEDKKFSILFLEKKAGLKINAVHNILSGKSLNPKMSTLIALSKALECSIEDLINGQLISSKPESYTSENIEIHNSINIEKTLWNSKLYRNCLYATERTLEEKNFIPTVKQLDFILRNVYNYSIRKELKNNNTTDIHLINCEADQSYIDWVITNIIDDVSNFY